jgi:hypothetical protein
MWRWDLANVADCADGLVLSDFDKDWADVQGHVRWSALDRRRCGREAIGICIEFCAAAEVGSIKPPPPIRQPAKIAVVINDCLRALSSFVELPGEEVYKTTGLRLGRSEISTANRTSLTERGRLTFVNYERR